MCNDTRLLHQRTQRVFTVSYVLTAVGALLSWPWPDSLALEYEQIAGASVSCASAAVLTASSAVYCRRQWRLRGDRVWRTKADKRADVFNLVRCLMWLLSALVYLLVLGLYFGVLLDLRGAAFRQGLVILMVLLALLAAVFLAVLLLMWDWPCLDALFFVEDGKASEMIPLVDLMSRSTILL